MSSEQPAGVEDGALQRLSPLTPIARSGIFLVVAGYVVGRQVIEDHQDRAVTKIAAAIGIALLAGLVFGLASWYRTFFRISETELRIDTGVVSRRSRRVRLDRVLEVGVEQPFVARLLGLAELRIETATSESEVKLAYLRLAEAHRVREVLLARRQHALAAEGRQEPAPPGTPPTPGTITASTPILEVPLHWQLVGVVASPETFGLIGVGAVLVVLLIAGVPFGAFGVGIITVLGAGLSLARKVTGWWGWQVSRVPSGIQVRHGLLSVSTRTFNLERLQGVRITEPALQRPFGFARLDLSVAGGGIKDGREDDSTGVAIPVAPRALVLQVVTEVLGVDPDRVEVTAAPTRSLLTTFLGPWRWRFGMDERLVKSERGMLARRTDLVPFARVQSFRAVRGPWQRLVGTATVHGDSPVGLVQVVAPSRDPSDARSLVETGAARARAARESRSR